MPPDDQANNEASEIVDQNTPLSIIERSESQERVDTTINILRGNQLIAFNLWFVDDLKIPAIALLMNLSVGAIEQLLFRAKNRLKNYLKNKK